MNIDKAIEILSASNHRITRTRRLVLQTAFRIKSPFSATDLCQAIARKGKRVDLVTVYRNLHVLEESGIFCRTDFSDEMAHYMVSEPGHDHHHHHIVCRECHAVQPVDFCSLQAHEQMLKQLGFREVNHRLEFSGVCPTCA